MAFQRIFKNKMVIGLGVALGVGALVALVAVGLPNVALGQTPPNNGISSSPGPAPSQPAVPVPIGGPWQEFQFGATGTFAVACTSCVPSSGGNSVFAGPPPWTFAGDARLTVTDAFLIGDEFQVFDNAVSIGSTPVVANVGSCGDDPVPCSVNPLVSHRVFDLGGGAHSLTIKLADSPFNSGAAYFRLDPPPVEVDDFPNSVGVIALGLPDGSEVTQVLFGAAKAVVQINPVTGGGAADTDGDGKEQVKTEMVSLDLNGGGFNVTVNPAMPSKGEIEELVNNTPGILDVDPFKPGDASSFFDIFFVLTGPGLPGPLHNNVPLHIETVITEKPPASGQTYVHVQGAIELLNVDNRPSGIRLLAAGHTPVPPPMDHFKCHNASGPAINVPVTLQDQFDLAFVPPRVERKTVVKPVLLCNPVTKTLAGVHTGVTNPNTHLKIYTIAPAETAPVRSVVVNNQFGDQKLTVRNPVVLAVPTQKLPHGPFSGVDHFKCYVASGQPINRVVDLDDQFDLERNITVLQPVVFCNPVQKTRGTEVTRITHPDDHLVLYSLSRAPVVAINQFGQETLTIAVKDLLFVPSKKLSVTQVSAAAADSTNENGTPDWAAGGK